MTDPGDSSNVQCATFSVPSELCPSGAEPLFLACAFMTNRYDTVML